MSPEIKNNPREVAGPSTTNYALSIGRSNQRKISCKKVAQKNEKIPKKAI